MPLYRVTDGYVFHDGKGYGSGETIELTEEQAARLRVELVPGDGHTAGNKGKGRK